MFRYYATRQQELSDLVSTRRRQVECSGFADRRGKDVFLYPFKDKA